MIIRVHSFPQAAEFRAEPRNLGFYLRIKVQNFAAEFVFLPRNLTFSFEQLFSPQSSSVISLFTLIFGFMVMVD